MSELKETEPEFCFTGILKQSGSIVKDEDVKTKFTILHVKQGDDQNFLEAYEDVFETSNIQHLFREPVRWKTCNIECDERVNVKFDALEFKADLKEIKITVKEIKDEILYQYNFIFHKSQSKDIDIALSSYLKHKEDDENGKKQLVEYDIEFECL